MAADMIPRSPGYVSVGSRRYKEWQTLAFEATTDRKKDPPEESTGPLVDHPTYPTPKKILTRPNVDEQEKTKPPETIETHAATIETHAVEEEIEHGDVHDRIEEFNCSDEADRRSARIKEFNCSDQVDRRSAKSPAVISTIRPIEDDDLILDKDKVAGANYTPEKVTIKEQMSKKADQEQESPDASIYSHESGELYAEDVDQHMVVLPEVITPITEVSIDDVQVGDPNEPLTEDQKQLQLLIWEYRHLLIGKGNALPPAARGAVCDIDVGGASPIAQRVRPVAPKFVKN